jgi:hypothetical protein
VFAVGLLLHNSIRQLVQLHGCKATQETLVSRPWCGVLPQRCCVLADCVGWGQGTSVHCTCLSQSAICLHHVVHVS